MALRYVIIGNGVAGTAAASAIRKIDGEGRIIIVSDEPCPFYGRIRLPEYLAGEVDERELLIRKDSWYEQNQIELLMNVGVSSIDTGKKQALVSSGGVLPYDRLLIATGASSFVPPVPGADKKGVFTLRTLKDAGAIREYAETSRKRAILIGGGVLGLEAGNSLRKLGCRVSVIEFFPRLLPRQMDDRGAKILKARLEKMGFTFFLGALTKEITGGERADGITLGDGVHLEGDLILISAGVRPNISLAEKAGVAVGKGITVNDRMETNLPGIYAAGDVVEHCGICYGIWPAAERQGEVAGINMAGGSAEYHGTTIANTLKVAGIDLTSAGEIDADGKKEAIVAADEENLVYKKLVIEGNKIIGAILLGDIKYRGKIIKAIEQKKDISEVRKELEDWDLEALS